MYGLLTTTAEQLKTIESDIRCNITLAKELPEEVYAVLVIECQWKLATTFHGFMTKGQTFGSVNNKCAEFYARVIKVAKKVSFCLFHHLCDCNMPSKFNNNYNNCKLSIESSLMHSPTQYVDGKKEGICSVGRALCKFVDPFSCLIHTDKYWWPLIILSFDEPHILMNGTKEGEWTTFS